MYHFVHLFAEPLVIESRNGEIIPLPLLDIEGEREMISSLFDDAGRRIAWISMNATTTNLATALAKRCPIMHLSGHGEVDKFLFEHEGKAHVLSAKDIVTLTQNGLRDLKVLVVTACHSASIGAVFAETGVPFVIAVQSSQAIMDEACKEMTKVLYENLFNGRSVVDSFESGKSAVRLKYNLEGQEENKKFVLMRRDDTYDQTIFGSRGHVHLEPGPHVPHHVSTELHMCLTPRVFVGRQIEIQALYEQLLRSVPRVLVLTGVLGVGKTALVLRAVSYMSRRKVFDVAYNVDLSMRDEEGFVWTDEWAREHATRLCAGDESRFATVYRAQCLKPLIRLTSKVLFPTKAKEMDGDENMFLTRCTRELASRKVLLVLNHCEIPNQRNRKHFILFLRQLQQHVPYITILLLAVVPLPGLTISHTDIAPLKPLSDRDTAEMFLKCLPEKPKMCEIDWYPVDQMTREEYESHQDRDVFDLFAETDIVKRLRGLPRIVKEVALLRTHGRHLRRDREYFCDEIDRRIRELDLESSKIQKDVVMSDIRNRYVPRSRSISEHKVNRGRRDASVHVSGMCMWHSISSSSHVENSFDDALSWDLVSNVLCACCGECFDHARTRPFSPADFEAVYRTRLCSTRDMSEVGERKVVQRDMFVRFWDTFWTKWMSAMRMFSSLWALQLDASYGYDARYLTWGFLDRHDVEEILSKFDTGTFLIRMSLSHSNGVVVSVRLDGTTAHIMVNAVLTADNKKSFEMIAPEKRTIRSSTVRGLLLGNPALKRVFPDCPKERYFELARGRSVEN